MFRLHVLALELIVINQKAELGYAIYDWYMNQNLY